MTAQVGEIGAGPLARAASVVHWYLVVDVLMVLVAAPGLVVTALLAPAASNAPLVVLAALPVGPALAAGLYAWQVADTDRDLSPARHVARGLRRNTVDALRLWVPALAVLAVVAANVALNRSAGLPRALVGVSLLLALVVGLWLANATVIVARFSFRTRDTARLAAYSLFRHPGTALATASLLVVATGLLVLLGEWALLPTAGAFAWWLHRHSRALRADIEERFTA
ncbi:hypothetical protein CHO01_13080 [Cellulomonas hominis]|uniref:DUF624 domain-containing protein n=1 Tax=Cellulomonas hominis TaxID=156981 RepID=A0A511FAB8_9CELL|nr:hypothetical protein [Cellulomonas hominis]MBB5472074.1 hypothetical protein [Cellulomonas hominis]GEL46192.1 hypothetical protein CHO01_13080 [Cellulomonas hominis]